MITIESTDGGISVFIPRADVDPVRLEQMLRPLRLEAAVSASRMTDEDADRMAEDMKATWWAENQHRFLPADLS